jgi:hypothetical protein
MKFEDIFELCGNTNSAAPVECYQKLSLKERSGIGMKLCAAVTSPLPSECWRELMATKSANKIPESDALDFCRSIDDMGPIHCVKKTVALNILSPQDSLNACLYATVPSVEDTDTPEACLVDMKKDIQPSLGVEAADVVQFCHAISTPGTTAPQDCYHNISSNGDLSKILTPLQRLQLCWDTELKNGPPECVEEVKASRLHTGSATSPGLSSDEIVDLCMHATSSGPAKCYEGAKNVVLPKTIASKDVTKIKLQVCARAPNDGPARCFRRALVAFKPSSAAMHKSPYLPSIDVPPNQDHEVYYSTALCISADSEGPAECALKAASWLSHDEKLLLCGGHVPAGRAQEPLRCVEAISNSQMAKRLTNSPRKCLGYFLGNLMQDAEKKSRYHLLTMCSFAGSDNPLAAAECFRTAPTVLDHDTAVVSVCTNHSQVDTSASAKSASSSGDSNSTDSASSSGSSNGRSTWELKYDPHALSSCVQLLPSDWSGEDKGLLCSRVNSTLRAEAVVTCAIDLHKTARLLSKSEAAAVCADAVTEEGDEALPGGVGGPGGGNRRVGGTAACVRRAFTENTASSVKMEPDVDLIINVCKTAQKGTAGSCVAHFSTKSKSNMLTRESLQTLCSSPNGLSRRSCVQHVYTHRGKRGGARSSSPLSLDDVKSCLSQEPVVSDIRVTKFQSADNYPEAMAGKRFEVQLLMIDQWGQNMEGVNGVRLLASINENNDQGAVLWGIRTNTSVNGM